MHDESIRLDNVRHVEPRTFHERMEGRALALSAGSLILVAIGGIIEFVPVLLMEVKVPSTVETRPYTPLELEGRDLYIREGCYNCHSQSVRFFQKEEMRYGPASEASEFIYDYPFQWGSKRTGPDLQRLGGRYPHLWHYKHMLDPRSTSPGSIMPSYPWLLTETVDIKEVAAKIKAMSSLGVPYSAEVLANPNEAYREQAREIVESLRRDGIESKEDQAIIAMIAYLQKLGTDYPKPQRQDRK